VFALGLATTMLECVFVGIFQSKAGSQCLKGREYENKEEEST